MFHRFPLTLATLLLGIALVAGAPAPGPKPPDFSKLKEESIKKWSGAEVLLTGKLAKVIPGPVGQSSPPVYNFRLQIVPDKVLRGLGRFAKELTAHYSVRQEKAPTFPDPDKECLIALKFVRDAWVVQSADESTPERIAQAQLATSFPLGWTIKEGKLVSPWAATGTPGNPEGIACAVTGRPVLLAGPAVRFTVEPVPPEKKVQFANPDGDGAYKLIVKNESEAEVEVPALLTDGKSINWNESIIIRCQDKAYPIPGSNGRIRELKSVVLKPGEAVSGTANVFALDGPQWPMGGYRIEFQFCLGEKSATHSFYYLSRHHDPIRAAVQKSLKK
jgi:hypothetical protein